MTKKNTICLRCGLVQVRTDINNIISDRYIVLEKKYMCPKCHTNTNMIVTNKIQILRKQLKESPNEGLDSYILKLIKK